jgi:hypothetical protein
LLGFDDGPLFDQNVETGDDLSLIVNGREQVDEVPDLSFLADIADETAIGVGVETRHVASIGVAVGVTIGDFEKEEEIVTVGEDI